MILFKYTSLQSRQSRGHTSERCGNENAIVLQYSKNSIDSSSELLSTKSNRDVSAFYRRHNVIIQKNPIVAFSLQNQNC